MKRITLILTIAATFVISARGQGFLNLNFESAQDLPGNPGDGGASVATANAMPGWTAYTAGTALADIYYVSNNFPGVSTLVELEGGSLALGGNYSVGIFQDGSISQTGMVPADTESLQFEASSELSLGLTLGGQKLSYSALSVGSGYTVYGANIPAGMGGQMEALTFSMGLSQTVLDNIEFSPMTIPEPTEYAIIGIGAILFAVHRRKRLASQS